MDDHLVPHWKMEQTHADLFSGIPLCRALHPDHPEPLSFPALPLRWSKRWVVAGLSKTGMDQLVVHGNSRSLRQIIWRNENSKGIYILSITHRASKVFWAEKTIRSVGTSGFMLEYKQSATTPDKSAIAQTLFHPLILLGLPIFDTRIKINWKPLG